MARLDNFTKKDMKGIAKEHFRELVSYKNYVDKERSKDNYHMNTELKNGSDFMLKTMSRVNAIMGGRDMQTQTNVISEWVITCPQELLGDSKQVKQFFAITYAFCQGRYGRDNVIDGFVHMDETTPHIHVCVVPEATSRKTGRKTVSSASLMTRSELSAFHADLDKECERRFHKAKLIKNGKTKGNLGLEQWKDQQARDKKHEQEIEQYRQFLSGYREGDKTLLEVFDEQHPAEEQPDQQPDQQSDQQSDQEPDQEPQKPQEGQEQHADDVKRPADQKPLPRKPQEPVKGRYTGMDYDAIKRQVKQDIANELEI